MADMEPKDYVSVLRLHLAHIRKLDAEMMADLTKLEQALSEQPGAAHMDTTGLLEEIVELQKRLAGDADMFRRRLQVFLAGIKKDGGSSEA